MRGRGCSVYGGETVDQIANQVGGVKIQASSRGVTDSTTDFGSVCGGSNPSESTIVIHNQQKLLMTEDERWMQSALREAEQAYKKKEVPIGAVVIHEGRIIGRGCNQMETLKDPTAHAEMIAITAAASQLENRRLERCTLYVTLEPCAMCAGAIVLARIPRLVFGTTDPKAGSCGTLYNIVQDGRLNHRVELVQGVLEERCSALLHDFFREVRTNVIGKPSLN